MEEIIKDCIVCGKEIFRANNQSKIKERRSNRAVTCSRECSRIFNRCSIYIKKRKLDEN